MTSIETNSQLKIDAKSKIEQKCFENHLAQSVFVEWCKMNDSIEPKFVGRGEVKDFSSQNIFQKTLDGKNILTIPTDLRLCEMIEVVKVIDQDTFAKKPERVSITTEKIITLGQTLVNTGIYIAKRLDNIENGKEIAESLALELFQYGQSLIQSCAQEIPHISEVARRDLTVQETEAMDRSLAGDTLYESRKRRAEKSFTQDITTYEKLYELERQKTIKQFFKVAEKALLLQDESSKCELKKDSSQLKSGQRDISVHDAFLEKVEKSLEKQIKTPKRELDMTIFRRGMDILTNEMRPRKNNRRGLNKSVNDTIISNKRRRSNLKTLSESLNISKLKNDLEQVRQDGNLANIVAMERQITEKIQKTISSLCYSEGIYSPSEIVRKGKLNCVGASILGGGLMQAVGLNYLVGGVPEHSILLLVTSDGQLEWRDMSTNCTIQLTDYMIDSKAKNSKSLTVTDIVELSQKSSFESLTIDIKGYNYLHNVPWLEKGQRQYLELSRPEYGQASQVLANKGCECDEYGFREKADEFINQAIDLNPDDLLAQNSVSLGRLNNTIKQIST